MGFGMTCGQVLYELYKQVDEMGEQELLSFIEGIIKDKKWMLRIDRIRDEYIWMGVYTYEDIPEGSFIVESSGFGVEVVLKSGLEISIEFKCVDGEIKKYLYIDN